MKKNPYPGKFIVFEGLDGSGQTTQAVLLKGYLEQKGIKVALTKEPTTESAAGQKLRGALDKKDNLSPKEFQELFAQDRKEHLANVIIPSLKQGEWVISDRYFFTSFAYGTAEGIQLEYLIQVNNNFLLPDITFFLKVNPATCLDRIQQRGKHLTYFERKEHFERAWKMFETLAKRFANIFVVNGEQPIEKVAQDVHQILTRKLK